MAQIVAGTMHAHDGGDIETARQDGGVRHRTAVLGDEGANAAVAQQDGIRRGQIGGDDDAPGDVGGGQGLGRRLAAQKDLDLPHNVVDIVASGAQIVIIHAVEDLHQAYRAASVAPNWH
jgi:hypothetical protein